MNKTELIIFRSPKKQICKNINLRLSGQKIEPKHHSFSMNIVMSFDEYMNTLKQKLNRGNGISAKLRRQIWGKSHSKTFNMVQSTQNIALRIISLNL